MEERRFKRLGRLEELPEGQPAARRVGAKEFLVVRRGEKVHVCGNKCPHQGASLSDGLLLGGILTCPCHTARFDIATGTAVAAPALDGIPVYEVQVENGEVFVGPVSRSPEIPRPGTRESRLFVIAGGGAAGNAAAETLRGAGFGGRILMLSAEPELPYDRTVLSKGYLSGQPPAPSLALRSEEFYRALEVDVETRCEVRSIDPVRHTLTLSGGRSLGYDKLLLATGGAPRRLGITGEGLDGCFCLRSRSDAEGIAARLQPGRPAVILGAGFIGLEAAASLTARGVQVTVVAPETLPLAAAFGEQIGGWLRALHESRGVRFALGRLACEIRGGETVEEVLLSDSSRLPARLVIIGAGVRPAVDCLEGTGLIRDGAVPVDGRLESRAAGLFAAGDVAAVPGPGGLSYRMEHWVVAERQGQHAARSMLGHGEPYSEVPFFWTEQFGVTLKYCGFPGGFDRLAVRGSLGAGRFLAGYFSQSVLRAVAAVGRDRELAAAGELIRRGGGRGGGISPEQLQDEGTDLLELLGPSP